MNDDNGAAARLERLTELRRTSPDAKSPDPMKAGVTEAWLSLAFEMDVKTVKEKLKWCPPKRIIRRGKTMQTRYYELKEASRFLVVPAMSTQDYMRELKRGQLPPSLQQSVWDALLKRQTWEERAGQLWRTDKVREVLGSTFQTIKFTVQLWAETVERQKELSGPQRELIVEMSDLLLREIYEALVLAAQDRSTGAQITEMADYVGDEQPIRGVIADVEDPEDDIAYTIESMV